MLNRREVSGQVSNEHAPVFLPIVLPRLLRVSEDSLDSAVGLVSINIIKNIFRYS